MKKAVALSVLLLFLVGCAAWKTAAGRTETMVISYESVGTIAFPTILAYLQQREKNGSLAGDSLVNAKKSYALAKSKFIQAGDLMIKIINGSPAAPTISTIALLLREAAIILADLSKKDGGKVEGNTLTIPAGGAK